MASSVGTLFLGLLVAVLVFEALVVADEEDELERPPVVVALDDTSLIPLVLWSLIVDVGEIATPTPGPESCASRILLLTDSRRGVVDMLLTIVSVIVYYEKACRFNKGELR
jgi:hypothetical protein